ncbi:unnamed protein product, partial [Symbiodinium pilosum]
ARPAGAPRRCEPGCYEGSIKELFELSEAAPTASESRASLEARVWQATRRQAARIKVRPAWQPNEVPLARRRQQEREWKRLLAKKPSDGHAVASTCSATRSSRASAVSSIPAGIPTNAFDKQSQRSGCFLWRSQAVPAFYEKEELPRGDALQVPEKAAICNPIAQLPAALNVPDDATAE